MIISAGVLFIWGAICLKLSHMHFSHNLFLKRLNILVLCVSVLVEIIQPDLNVYRVSALYPQGVLKRYDCYEWLTVSTCAFYMLGLDIESRLHRILSFL